MNIPVYNCLVDENLNDESGIYAISFVESPANETDFVALAGHPRYEMLSKDRQKQILTGVVLRPDQLIYRSDVRLGEYYIRFSAEQIEKIAQKMMRTGIALNNTTHQHQTSLNGNYLTELWIVEDPENDKSRALGFPLQPQGTLMCSYKVEDKNYWDTEVMSGNVKGFSLEGLFIQERTAEQTNMNKNQNNRLMNKNTKKSKRLLSKVARFLLDIQAVEKADAAGSGTLYMVFTLTDGKEIYVDADGFTTLDDKQLPAGEHPLADGSILVVDEDGQFIETKQTSDKPAGKDQAIAPQTLADEEQPVSDEAKSAESADVLKAKIADLESKLSELAGLAKEANTEVQKLRRHTPSTMPLAANRQTRKIAEMKRYEQMAQALSLTIRQKNR